MPAYPLLTPHEICIALRRYRIRARLGQKTIADCLGVAQSQISRWESGREQPRAHNVEAISRLILGPRPDPVAALAHFVAESEQNLVLVDADHRIVARALPLGAPASPLERFGWAIDPDANPAFAPAARRYRDILADARAVLGITIHVPLRDGDRPLALRLRHTVHEAPAGPVCLAEIGLLAGESGPLRLEEIRLDQDGRPRRMLTRWT